MVEETEEGEEEEGEEEEEGLEYATNTPSGGSYTTPPSTGCHLSPSPVPTRSPTPGDSDPENNAALCTEELEARIEAFLEEAKEDLEMDNIPPAENSLPVPVPAPVFPGIIPFAVSTSQLSSDAIFVHIFVHFRPNFTSPSLPHTFLPYVHHCYAYPLMSSYALHAHEQTTRTQFNWYYRTPNDTTTGLPTFRNSPAVVPPHLDPVLEPLLPPPNAPTTQSSRLPRHRAQVGVHPSRECSW